MKFSGFEWDEGNWPKCGKHGVTREEIELLFASARVAPDLLHSQQEKRYIAVGRNQSGRAMFVAFAIKQAQGSLHRIRPISARFMHKKEVQRYEENSDTQN